jgi:antitoxin component HigA of HigAB toxin-antitoxin module
MYLSRSFLLLMILGRQKKREPRFWWTTSGIIEQREDAMDAPKLLNPLRAYRVDRGLSVSDLAGPAGMSRAELVAVEAGARLLTRDQCIDVAQRLRVDPAELAAYTE